jgi:hypothetical protein
MPVKALVHCRNEIFSMLDYKSYLEAKTTPVLAARWAWTGYQAGH